MRRPHRSTFRWAALLALLSLDCAQVERRPTRLTVAAEGQYGEAINTDYSCEGDRLSSERHRNLGGALSARYEMRDGFLAGATVRALHAVLTSVREYEPGAGDDVDDSPYALIGGGFFVGYDLKYFGGEAGVSFSGIIGLDDGIVMPYAQLRAGDLDRFWGEATFGTYDPLSWLSIGSLGVGLRGDQGLRLRAGLTFYGKVMQNVSFEGDGSLSKNITTGTNNDGFDFGTYAEAEYSPTSSFGLTGGVLLSEAPTLRLGISYTFGGD